MKNHTLILKKLLSFLLILTLALQLPACKSKPKVIYTGTDFDPFIEELFRNEVQSDSITLNYTIAKPENYGITNYKPTFGSYGQKNMKESQKYAKSYIKKLEQFDYETLLNEQKITYDIIYKYLKDHCYSDKLFLYNEVLSPTTGLQAQLPVLLAEFHFHDKQDIIDYITLLNELKGYFVQIIDFEKEKSKAGLFMSDACADNIIAQCNAFISNKENNYLITLFNEKIDSYTALSKEERNSFKEQNKNAVLNSIIPAYKLLITELTSLKGTGQNNGGLCNFKKGKEYYEHLVRITTASDRSMKDINKLLDHTIAENLLAISSVSTSDENIRTKLMNYYYPLTDPKEILTYLQGAISSDFPPLENINCTIKYVDKSLEDYLSPAFYLTPQLDNFNDNCIYINQNKKYDLSEIFTTIAHEGYPGHLYQNCYYNQKNPPHIRHILNFEGYSEGWATYVEMYSYSISGLDSNVSKVLMNNQVATLCIYAKCDLNINYYGWDLNATKEYLKGFGFTDDSIAKNMYQTMIEEPCNYLKYTLGYLEFSELRKNAESQLGNKFSALNFNQFLLDMGPCQFAILEKYLKDWIQTQ